MWNRLFVGINTEKVAPNVDYTDCVVNVYGSGRDHLQGKLNMYRQVFPDTSLFYSSMVALVIPTGVPPIGTILLLSYLLGHLWGPPNIYIT